ncbi:hypothetical protein [Deinococcus radiophilus]|uniref:hypothetical protein n=1 Tax=Deinococcus radiophilus TaxID=32062 RepID=UPI00361D7FD0
MTGTPVSQTVRIASPLPRAHAHNDYEHDRPLLDALAQGFTSVESDVFLRGNELLVAHEASQLQPGRTLQTLYLEPLRQIAAQNGGHIYPGGQSLTLYIDVKDEAEATYQAIDRVLAGYSDLLTRYDNGTVTPGAVTVIISGNRVPATMQAQALRYAGMDGRLSDLGGAAPASLIPIISDNWTKTFSWDGTGSFLPPSSKSCAKSSARPTRTVSGCASGPPQKALRCGRPDRRGRRPDQHRQPERTAGLSAGTRLPLNPELLSATELWGSVLTQPKP